LLGSFIANGMPPFQENLNGQAAFDGCSVTKETARFLASQRLQEKSMQASLLGAMGATGKHFTRVLSAERPPLFSPAEEPLLA